MKRKSMLRSVCEILSVPLKYRSARLMLAGTAVICISLPILVPILDYYNLPRWLVVIPAYIGLGITLLGVMNLGSEETEPAHAEEAEEDEHKEIMQRFNVIEKELREIKNRLEKIEGYL